MSAKGGKDPDVPENVPVQPESLSTDQEVIPVPYLFGTRLIALRWATAPINVFAVQAKDARPGKKS